MGWMRSILVLAVVALSACKPDAELPAADVPQQTLRGGLPNPCAAETLTVCAGPYTGPTCSFTCDVGGPGGGGTTTGESLLGTTGGPPEGCDYRVYCHDDESLWGIALFNAHLFEFDPTDTPAQITSAFEAFIAEHEADLGLAAGLTTNLLSIEPADNFVVGQGQLWLYRFVQTYPIRYQQGDSLDIAVLDASTLLTLEADDTGATTLKGTVVDPRAAYANHDDQASPALAASSIAEHTSVETGVDAEEIEIESLQLVAVPSLQRVAWYGRPRVGPVHLARVLVDADPQEEKLLDLLRYDVGDVEGLSNTSPISVRTQNLSASDPWADPLPESVQMTRADGEPLLGSTFDGNNELQLGTTEVVVLDLLGGDFSIMSSTDFARYTDSMGEFEVTQPGDQFHAQRLYHLVQSGYALVDRVALGKWDSAVQHEGLMQASPVMLTSDFDPGTFRPRILVGHNHASTGAGGRTNAVLPPLGGEMILPEFYHRPDPNNPALQHELVALMKLNAGLTPVDNVLHEAGHCFDYFLAPGFPQSDVPADCTSCTAGCDEDTTDEAWPLTETIAQMFALWQFKRLFPNLDHDTCDLMARLTAGGNDNNAVVHSPGCLTETDEIGLFIRDDDGACVDTAVCDKPERSNGTLDQGGPNRCRTTDGYHTFSILQAWWNTLHGLYCEPTYPFACTSVAVTWPPGCDQMGSPVECVTPDEAAGLAFLYALRTNPLTYVDFFDSMARFVSCNYGPVAYDDLNQALCEHEIRSCSEPPPSDCEVCGNGIREGGEECDGTDLSVDVLGYVPGCTDFEDFIGGVLGCTPQCTYDKSQCVPPPDTTGGSSEESGAEEGGDDGTGATGATGGADGGAGEGCSCDAAPKRGDLALWTFAVLLLAAQRSRRKRTTNQLPPAVATFFIVAMSSCADDAASSSSTSSSNGSTDSGATSAHETGDTGQAIAGWPESWFGDYHQDVWITLGQPQTVELGFMPENFTLGPGSALVEFYSCTSGEEPIQRSYRVVFEDDRALLLPEHEGQDLLWRDGPLRQIVVRPLDTCERLEITLDYGRPVLGPESPHELVLSPFLRGHVCVVDTCDDYDEERVEYILDYCPDTVRDCDPPATESN